MNIEKIIPWSVVALLLCRPFYFLIDTASPLKMNAIKLMFSIGGWWLLAGVLAAALVALNPWFDARAEKRLQRQRDAQARLEEEEAALQAAPLGPVTPVQTLLKSNEMAYAFAAASVQNKKPRVSGELVVTNQRIIFTGPPHSFAWTLDSLINVTHCTNGGLFENGKSSILLKIEHPKECHIFLVTLKKVIARHK